MQIHDGVFGDLLYSRWVATPGDVVYSTSNQMIVRVDTPIESSMELSMFYSQADGTVRNSCVHASTSTCTCSDYSLYKMFCFTEIPDNYTVEVQQPGSELLLIFL